MTLSRRGLALGLTLAALSPPALAAGRRRPGRGAPHAWPERARAAVSLTYDDGLDSQLANVVPELDRRGLKGTFYITKENMEGRTADWQAVGRAGHEIADHSVHHPCNLAAFSPQSFYEKEIAPMEDYLGADFGAGPHDWAYPCGFGELGRGAGMRGRANAYRQIVDRTFLSGRGVEGGPNDPRDVARRRGLLGAFEPTYDRDDPAAGKAYLDRAMAAGHWAILVFHEVLPQRVGDGDTSIAVHRQILDDLQARPVWCAPVRTVLADLKITKT